MTVEQATANSELEEFKEKVKAVAQKYKERHGWCVVVDEALEELGLGLQFDPVNLVVFGQPLPIHIEKSLNWQGKTKEHQKRFLRNILKVSIHSGGAQVSCAEVDKVRIYGNRPNNYQRTVRNIDPFAPALEIRELTDEEKVAASNGTSMPGMTWAKNQNRSAVVHLVSAELRGQSLCGRSRGREWSADPEIVARYEQCRMCAEAEARQ